MSALPDAPTSPTLLGRLRDLADAQAWKEFVRRYGPGIYGWCRQHGLQDADAQDVTQCVLTKLALALQTFEYDRRKSFRGWLATVTHNAWCDFLENRRKDEQGSGNGRLQQWLESLPAAPCLADGLEQEFQREQLDEAITRVGLRVERHTWEAFWLTALEGLSGKAAARRLGISVGAVYVAKSRVQDMLRQEITKLQGNDAE
jgi:RNA polymerase sigma factor (sigma-70 family)